MLADGNGEVERAKTFYTVQGSTYADKTRSAARPDSFA